MKNKHKKFKGFGNFKECEKEEVCDLLVDFIDDRTTNVYRTMEFIVNQKLSVCESSNGNDVVMSTDTYYPRTPDRDMAYECLFGYKGQYVNGKRMRSAMFTRKYITY
jgi:hypothetical protein